MHNKTNYIIGLALSLFLVPSWVHGQERDFEKEFEEFQQKQQKEFDDFKNKADAEYANFLRAIWEKFESFDEGPAPSRPEPVEPVVFDDSQPSTPPLEIPTKVPEPMTIPDPVPGQYVPGKPYMPVKVNVPVVPPGRSVHRTPVELYGTTFYIATDAVEDLRLKGNSEANVADAWTKVCKADYEQLIVDCVTAKNEKRLSDWAYLLFTKQIGEQLYGPQKKEQIAFLQMFILAKSGYKVRLAKVGDELKLLISPAGKLYATPFIRMDGGRYYVFEPMQKEGGMSIFTYQQDFAESKNLVALHIPTAPVFDMDAYSRTFQSKDKDIVVETTVNRNLVNFYKDYPQCDVEVHFKTPMSEDLKKSLYPTLQKAIEGKSQKDAANILIAFVQTAFDYKTDDDQFGYEKPYFYEENFFYPFNDCEDRAMLYATLVSDLLGVEAILLDYPDHIASAVCFDENIEGDYVTFEDKKYVICDPTFIGAPIGMSMDQYRYVAPGVIR